MGALGKDGSVISPKIVGRSVAVLGVDLVISEKSSTSSHKEAEVLSPKRAKTEGHHPAVEAQPAAKEKVGMYVCMYVCICVCILEG